MPVAATEQNPKAFVIPPYSAPKVALRGLAEPVELDGEAVVDAIEARGFVRVYVDAAREARVGVAEHAGNDRVVHAAVAKLGRARAADDMRGRPPDAGLLGDGAQAPARA
jgi:hypothetical protein